MKEVVIFNGSPRMDGNTVTLLNAVADGVRDHGGYVQWYTLLRMKFNACQSCFSCRFGEDCALKDELYEALQKIKTADAVVIGSPIYMMQMSGPVKNLYDRFFPLMDDDFQPRFGTKKLVTVYCQGFGDPHMFDSYFEYTAAIFPWMGFDLVENIVCTGANDPESAERDEKIKKRAYDVGKALAGK